MNQNGIAFDYNLRDVALVVFFTSAQFSNLLAKIFGISLGNTILNIVLLFVFLLAMYEEAKCSGGKGVKSFLLVFALTQVIILSSYLLNPQLAPWLGDSHWGLPNRFYPLNSGFYALLALVLVGNPHKIIKNFKIVVLLRFAHGLLAYRNYLNQGGWLLTRSDGVTEALYSYNMGFGYSMAFIALISFAILYLYKDYFFGLIGAAATVMSVLYGSRGVFIIFGSFLVLFFLILEKDNRIKMIHYFLQAFIILMTVFIFDFVGSKMIILIPLLLSSAIFLISQVVHKEQKIKYLLLAVQVICFIPLLVMLGNAIIFGFGEISTGSRNLDKLINFNITDSNGRDIIWRNSFDGIKAFFPFGNGAFGDRVFVDPTFPWGYSHNIFLEMTLSFGLIGIAFLIYVILRSFKYILDKKISTEYKILLIIFLSASSKLLVSDSFWFSMEFWGLMGGLLFGKEVMKSNIMVAQIYEK